MSSYHEDHPPIAHCDVIGRYAEDYQDVIHADAIKTTDGTKAPDYCFRIGGTRKFFLEARCPSVDIKNDVSPAFQLRRYGLTEAEITIVVERNEPAHPAPPPAMQPFRFAPRKSTLRGVPAFLRG